jgi:hypothetical protein
VVYVAPGTLNAAGAYIMDKTGGIEIFNVPSTVTLAVGDSIRVRGLLDSFRNELEVAQFPNAAPPVIEKLGTGAIPQPVALPATAIGSPDFAGSLIKLFGLTVTGKPNTFTATTGSYNVPVVAANGTAFQIRIDNRATGVDTAFWQVGTRYDVAGVSVNFQNTPTSAIIPQIKPRSPADISVSSAVGPTKSIADIKALVPPGATGNLDSATVDGVVTAGQGTFNAGSVYIFDGTGGTLVFGVPTALNLVPGDLVRVHGHLIRFGNGQEIEFTNANMPAGDTYSVVKLGQGPIVDPMDITGAQLVARTGDQQLVRVRDVTVTSMSTQTSVGVSTYTVNGTAADGTPVVIFMSAPTTHVPAQAGLFVVGGHYDLTGIEVPFLINGVIAGELKPRGAFDVVAR